MLILNILAIPVLLALAWAFSLDKKKVDWISVAIVLVLMLVLGWFFTSSSYGQKAVEAAANGFAGLVHIADTGIGFALPDWLKANNGGPNFVTGALLPILLIVPLFDILTYIGVLPFIIRWIGRGLSFITRQPRFEAFFSIEMMFLGNTEVLAISKEQLNQMSERRNLTLAMMSMSSVTAAVIGSYVGMVPGKYVLMAIPLNILGAIIFSAIINPVKLKPEEDTVAEVESQDGKKEPFFSFLSSSILGAGKLILIITATVIAFVALAAFVDWIFALTPFKWLRLENIFGVIMYPFALLLGFNWNDAFHLSQMMGMKLVTNEFVVMLDISKNILAGTGFFKSEHATAVTTVFLTSFANFSTLGMVIGAFRGLTGDKTVNFISSKALYMFISGILVSVLSAAIAGLFVW